MGKMAMGYGSEFHLLRFLGRHRNELTEKVLGAFGVQDNNLEWFDFKYDAKNRSDKEFVGIEFLKPNRNIESAWNAYWPQSGTAQNWDAIAKLGEEWILVEAKARAGEMQSDCGASSALSKTKIEKAFEETKSYFGIMSSDDWTKKYYQKANRISFLHFLEMNDIKAKMLFIYFVNGFEKQGTTESVGSEYEWQCLINEQDNYLGIEDNLKLKNLIRNLFIDVG